MDSHQVRGYKRIHLVRLPGISPKSSAYHQVVEGNWGNTNTVMQRRVHVLVDNALKKLANFQQTPDSDEDEDDSVVRSSLWSPPARGAVILAPPGCGKTWCLAQCIAALLVVGYNILICASSASKRESHLLQRLVSQLFNRAASVSINGCRVHQRIHNNKITTVFSQAHGATSEMGLTASRSQFLRRNSVRFVCGLEEIEGKDLTEADALIVDDAPSQTREIIEPILQGSYRPQMFVRGRWQPSPLILVTGDRDTAKCEWFHGLSKRCDRKGTDPICYLYRVISSGSGWLQRVNKTKRENTQLSKPALAAHWTHRPKKNRNLKK